MEGQLMEPKRQKKEDRLDKNEKVGEREGKKLLCFSLYRLICPCFLLTCAAFPPFSFYAFLTS